MTHNNKDKHQVEINNNNNEKDIMILADMVRDDRWTDILNLLISNPSINLDTELINGNNLFHMACIKGQTEFIKKLLELKKQNKLKINTNLFNIDGLLGAHLYYKFGGTDPFLLSNNEMCYVDVNNFVLARYLIDKIDLLEMLINLMIKKGCIENIGIRDDDYMFELLMEKEMYYTKIDKPLASQYLQIIQKLTLELKPENLVFMAINMNCFHVIEMLMKMNFDFNVYSSGDISAVSACVFKNRPNILVMILEYTKIRINNHAVFRMINASDIVFDARPIFVAIDTNNTSILSILVSYMREYVDETQIILDYTDTTLNTYLQWLLSRSVMPDVSDDIIRFFIDHTDLNHENYAGITSAHLLFGKGIWKRFKTSLIGRQIDLLKVDDTNNNCYSYISPDDKAEFLELTKKIIVPLDIKNTKDINNIFNVRTLKNILEPSMAPTLSPDPDTGSTLPHSKSNESIEQNTKNIGTASIDRIKSKNYGLFNTDIPHYMLYLKYLMKKYSMLYVPNQEYDKEIVERDLFFLDMTSYITSPQQLKLVLFTKRLHTMLYSYVPCVVVWINTDCYYVHPHLVRILSKHNANVDVSNQRYVMLRISLIMMESLHANVLIYDRLNREAWRFEPYGTTDAASSGEMDSILKEILTKVYGTITYHDPESYLYGLNFQMVDGEDDTNRKNLGDPGGYCLAWCIWFVDIVLSHPDKNVEYVMRNFFSRSTIDEILSEEEGSTIKSTNYYLDFIRRYAHKLDDEKNTILTSMGVKNYYIYNTVFRSDVLNMIIDMFKIKPKN